MFVNSCAATFVSFAFLIVTANGFQLSFHQTRTGTTTTTATQHQHLIDTVANKKYTNRLESSTTSLYARRKSLRKTLAAGNNARGIKPMGEGDDNQETQQSGTKKKTNWVPVQGITSMSDLPKEENTVKLVDTMATQLINGATNPTGAVSIINYDGKTYCFSSSCACCQIPLSKAKVLPPNDETGGKSPRLTCDFCKATYNIRTGERVQNSESAGLLGGVVAGLFSKKDKVPLAIYDLGEKNGQVLINLAK